MKATVIVILVLCLSTVTNANKLPQQSPEISTKNVKSETLHNLEPKDALVINLGEINKMGVTEYASRQIKALWDYLLHGSKEEPKSSFLGRCIGIGKKIRQLIPMVMIGGGVIITKLAFLVIFSLKTLGLVGLLLLLNTGTVAAKLGAYLASKKHDQAQNLHVHVQPWKKDEHVYSSSHLSGPPYGWDDRNDVDVQSHELYNLYEKLKFENNFRRFLDSNRRT